MMPDPPQAAPGPSAPPGGPALDLDRAAALGAALLEGFDADRRDLPWRRDRTPYRVWVAEVMLQQTRSEQAAPYFARFLERFPDVYALAAAPLDQVLRAWQGLGYYARARLLHAAARRLVEHHDGQLPADPDALRALPGFGPYTAAAVASIAFGRPAAVVDGNVERVLARLVALPVPPRSTEGRRTLAELAGALLDRDRPGASNEALMDLGATVCVPRRPRCPECPWQAACAARAAGDPERWPIRLPRPERPLLDVAAGVVWRDDRILIARRYENALMGGLWEFPGGKIEAGEAPEETCRREICEEAGIAVEVGPLLLWTRRTLTHRRLSLRFYQCRYLGGEPRPLGCSEVRWVRPAELPQFAFPTANAGILALLRDRTGPIAGQPALFAHPARDRASGPAA
jgi:A/G-specific adenine glycosylase